nr:hypothetical protein [Rhizobium sp. AB2/73]
MVEGPTCGTRHVAPFDYGSLRRRFSSAYITNNGYDLDPATSHLAEGTAKLIAFGRPFIANPDLVDRLQSGPPWLRSIRSHFMAVQVRTVPASPGLPAVKRSRRRISVRLP